jgi:hypothetical protein
MICDWKAPKVISLYFRDSSESQKYRTQVPTLLQVKNGTARQQMRVGAREGFAYHSVKLVILPNCYRYDVDSNSFFLLVVTASTNLKYCPVPTLTFIDTHSYL